jgi:hypothetical protein
MPSRVYFKLDAWRIIQREGLPEHAIRLAVADAFATARAGQSFSATWGDWVAFAQPGQDDRGILIEVDRLERQPPRGDGRTRAPGGGKPAARARAQNRTHKKTGPRRPQALVRHSRTGFARPAAQRPR